MKQRGITIVSPIVTGRIDDLDIVLRRIGDNIAKQEEIPFDSLTLLHYASWVIFRGEKPGPQLIFECNFDGPVETFLRQIVERARSGLDTIYQHCEGYPSGGSAEAVRSYFESHTVNT